MMRTINITQPSFGTKEIMLIKIALISTPHPVSFTITDPLDTFSHYTQSYILSN